MSATKVKYRRKSKGVLIPQKNLEEKVRLVRQQYLRSRLVGFDVGNSVKVHTRIQEGDKERIQVFEGIVIAKSQRDGTGSFVVRRFSHGVGVEKIFPYSSVAKIDVLQIGSVRRAKLYYLRKLKGKAARVQRQKEKF